MKSIRLRTLALAAAALLAAACSIPSASAQSFDKCKGTFTLTDPYFDNGKQEWRVSYGNGGGDDIFLTAEATKVVTPEPSTMSLARSPASKTTKRASSLSNTAAAPTTSARFTLLPSALTSTSPCPSPPRRNCSLRIPRARSPSPR